MKIHSIVTCLVSASALFAADPDLNTLLNDGNKDVQGKNYAAAEKNYEAAKALAKNDNDKFRCVSALSDVKAAQSDFTAMINILNAYSDDAATPADKKKAVLQKICALAHNSVVDKSLCLQIRNSAEKLLALDTVTLQEKTNALNCIDMTYGKAQEFENSIKTKQRLTALEGMKDIEKARLYQSIASIYVKNLKNNDLSKKNYLEAAKYFNADLAGCEGVEKAGKLAAVADFYRNQLKDKNEADKNALLAAEIYKSEAAKHTGIEKANMLFSLGNVYKNMNRKDDAATAYSDAIKITTQLIKDSKNLPLKEWLAAINPGMAMKILKSGKEGGATALTLAENVAAMPDVPNNVKSEVVSQADWICRFGGDSSLSSRLVDFIQMQVNLSSTTEGKANNLLRLGETYLRTNRNMAKAREIFASVVSNKEFPEKARENASLWLELLADK